MAPRPLPELRDSGGVALHGTLGRSASQPRIGPKHKLTVPEFTRYDISDRLKALGGLRVKTIGSQSTPDLRSTSRSSEPSGRSTRGSAAFPSKPKTPPTPPTPPSDTDGNLPSSGSWHDFVSQRAGGGSTAYSSGGGLGPLPLKRAQTPPTVLRPLEGRQSAAALLMRDPKAGDPLTHAFPITTRRPSSSGSASGTAGPPDAECPKVSHWNFAALPLETFDSVDDFETHTPDEWLEIASETPHRPNACVVHFKHNVYSMQRCWVRGYDEKHKKYTVEMEDATEKRVKRLVLRFNAEDADNFANRLQAAKDRKAHCELQESLISYVHGQDDSIVTPFARNNKERFIRHCIERCRLEDPNVHVPTVRELVVEAEADYVQAMKFCRILAEHIPGHGTRAAYIEEEAHFRPVLEHFLPDPIPWTTLVQNAQAVLRVGAIVLDLNSLPILQPNITAVTSMVWCRYFDEVERCQLLDTERGKVEKHHRLSRDKDHTKRVFELDEFLGHMQQHMKTITSFLARNWRDYLIAEITERLADHYNFFVDRQQGFDMSPLHQILRKFDVILNAQMRWLFAKSCQAWIDFMNSFIPSPSRCLPAPLLVLHLVPLDDQVQILPHPDDLLFELMTLLDKLPVVADDLTTMEHELLPFIRLPVDKIFEPLQDDVTRLRCPYQPLEDAKRVTAEVLLACLEGPKEIMSQFQQYEYLLQDEIEDDLDVLDVPAIRERINAYRTAGREVEVLTPTVLHFPLFTLRCEEIITALTKNANGLANQCLKGVRDSVDEGTNGILALFEVSMQP